MTDKNRTFSSRITDALQTDEAAHAANVVKAALATIPFTGGLASLMNDYIPDKRRERLNKLATKISDDLIRFEEKIDADTLKTEDFAFEFERCFKLALEENRDAKINAFRGIILNAALGLSAYGDQSDYFLSIVDRLSSLHIKLLSFMFEPQKYLRARGIPEARMVGGFSTFFPIAMEMEDVLAIQSAFGDLHQLGFTNTDKTMFNTTTAGQGLDLLGARLTSFGIEFVRFFSMPADD